MWGLVMTLLGMVGCDPIPYVAQIIGTTGPSLKLLISILMAYPIAKIYHKSVRMRNQTVKHIYLVATGMDIAFYNFGLSMFHNVIPVFVIFCTTIVFGPGKVNSAITFIFNMTYLVIGYAMTESEDYDITWTMPHCVLTLKLIALSFDLWDGRKLQQNQQVSTNSKLTAIDEMPTILQLLGFVYFPSCFLVGPIFSYRRYKEFVNDEFPLTTEAKTYERKAIVKLIQGLTYLIAFQIGGYVFSMEYMQSEDFTNNSIFYRHFYCGLWAHFVLYKYISCWLLTEATCIRFGFSYTGVKEDKYGTKISSWDGCNNIKLLRFEGATRFQHYIDSFNCNTNHFAAEYVYKRLKFLNNRNLSQLFTLIFLALWHGTRSGYYVTFLNEFLIMVMEKDVLSIVTKMPLYEKVWNNIFGKWVLYALLKAYTIVFMGWSLVPFDLKTYTKWWPVYTSLWLSGFVIFLPWMFIYKPLLKSVLRHFKLLPSTKDK